MLLETINSKESKTIKSKLLALEEAVKTNAEVNAAYENYKKLTQILSINKNTDLSIREEKIKR